MATNHASVSPETLITIKVTLNDAVKKLKLPIKDLNSTVLPDKLRSCLNISNEDTAIFERYSDSAGGYITLVPTNTAVYKALVRAAKAKGKLRLKASVIPPELPEPKQESVAEESKTVLPPVPTAMPLQRDSRALDHQSVGSGIFQYREGRASQQTLIEDAAVQESIPADIKNTVTPVSMPFPADMKNIITPVSKPFPAELNKTEAPVPKPFFADLKKMDASHSPQPCQELAFRTREPTTCSNMGHVAWSVYCNICDAAMADAHYHCSICDGGDYDLCETCVTAGKTCPGDGHWLIKRHIKDGKVVTSTTERISRSSQTSNIVNNMPGAYTEEAKVLSPEPVSAEITRTCNNCVVVLAEHEFVTCKSCDDFDLCVQCHDNNTHGHHPGHEFAAATADTVLSASSQKLMKPGRNAEHNAFCDGCDKRIFGVRHKCLQCPDWDYCNDCIRKAPATHPRHRFAALYEQLPEPRMPVVLHYGIYCDGPICNKNAEQSYIRGVRYKCAVCEDLDFCATCEALPNHHHNRTHPLIKFTTPVRNCSIETQHEDVNGNVYNMGDKRPERVVKSEANVAPIPVQTVADIAPTDEKVQKRSLPMDGDVVSNRAAGISPSLLNAVFVRDTIQDGTVVFPGERFTQVWTLRNEGPHAWPAGCSIKYVGGDNMLNVDNGRPSSLASINAAIESSVCARSVNPGEEISFSITLKAPLREGKSISYWRLKSAEGFPFGHRLWVDIDVRVLKPSGPTSVPALLTGTGATPAQPLSKAPVINATNQMYAQNLRAAQQSRMQALHQTRMRMLQQQQMLLQQRESLNSKAPVPVIPKSEHAARLEAVRARILQDRARFGANVVPLPKPVVEPFVKPAACDVVQFKPTMTEQTPAPVVKPEPVSEQQVAAEPAKTVEETPAVPVVVKDEPIEDLASASSSQMIFPKLEKESPASSIIASSRGKAAYVENEDGEVERSASPQPASTVDEPITSPVDELEEAEFLSISEVSDSEDDGFLTDEEYDILGASDEETVA